MYIHPRRKLIYLLLTLLPVSWPVQSQEKRPHILLITADDLGTQLGCYGDRAARTPHLDKFAGQGIRFAHAYVTQASCSPSRSSILTGLYPHQNGQIGLSHRGFAMQPGLENLPKSLKKAGYKTGIIGKLHVEPAKEFPFDFAHMNAKDTRDVAWVARQASEFIRRSDSAFFLYVNYFDPHVELLPQVKGIPSQPFTPEQVPAFPFQQIDAPREKQRIADYYSCITRMDEGIGRLLNVLDSLGVASNTLIIFVGDHGPPFARAKTSCYEAGVHIPFLLRWPQKGKGGTVSGSLVSTVDIVPTIFEAVGLSAGTSLPGTSLLPWLQAPATKGRDYLATEYHYHTKEGFFPRRAIRNQRYKLIHNLLAGQKNPTLAIDGDPAWSLSQQPQYAGTPVREVFNRLQSPPEFELYDLQQDPQEFTNLAGNKEYAQVLAQLQQALLAWRKQTQDPLLQPEKLREMAQAAQK